MENNYSPLTFVDIFVRRARSFVAATAMEVLRLGGYWAGVAAVAPCGGVWEIWDGSKLEMAWQIISIRLIGEGVL